MRLPLYGIGLGAALMYYLDPERGRSRRIRLREGTIHLTNELDHAIEVTSHDVINRTHGLVARGRSFLTEDHPPDAVIVARVRSNLGRVVSHPRAIQVDARKGRVTLSGPVLAAEVDRLLDAVRSVRGVLEVEDRLEVCDRPGDHPALRGGRRRTGERPELRQQTWSPTMRLLAVSTIGVVALRTVGARRLAGLALVALGAGAIARRLADGNPRRGRMSGRPGPRVATGAPIYECGDPHPSTAVRGIRDRPVIAYTRG
jgi:hypothetical protein